MTSIAIMAFLVGIKVYGATLPQFDRTIYQATLDERNADGHEIGIGLDKRLDLKNSGQDLGQFVLTEEKSSNCGSASCPTISNTTFFTIIDRQVDRCGNTKYLAVELLPINGLNSDQQSLRKLQVVDHRDLHCSIHSQDEWEISLYQTIGHLARTRHFTGDPKAVPVQHLPLWHVYY